MKKQLNLISLLLCLILIQVACHKNDPKPPTELEKLPTATMEGKNTFGCLVNGKAWIPETTLDARAVYQNNFLTVSGGIEEEIAQSMRMTISRNFVTGKKYILTDLQNCSAWFINDDDINRIRCEYRENKTIDGTIQLTRFDTQQFVISGTFEFRTVTDQCDSIKVTDGRFDLSLIL